MPSLITIIVALSAFLGGSAVAEEGTRISAIDAARFCELGSAPPGGFAARVGEITILSCRAEPGPGGWLTPAPRWGAFQQSDLTWPLQFLTIREMPQVFRDFGPGGLTEFGAPEPRVLGGMPYQRATWDSPEKSPDAGVMSLYTPAGATPPLEGHWMQCLGETPTGQGSCVLRVVYKGLLAQIDLKSLHNEDGLPYDMVPTYVDAVRAYVGWLEDAARGK